MNEVEHLRAFSQAVMESWPYGDVDGGYLQELAIKHGLLEQKEDQFQPCGEGCLCAESVGPGEFAQGVTCYRKTALLTGGAEG